MKKILTFSIILNIVLIAFLCYCRPSVNMFHSTDWENVKSRIIEKERANMHLTLQSLHQSSYFSVNSIQIDSLVLQDTGFFKSSGYLVTQWNFTTTDSNTKTVYVYVKNIRGKSRKHLRWQTEWEEAYFEAF